VVLGSNVGSAVMAALSVGNRAPSHYREACMAEISHIQELQEKYGKQGFTIIGISENKSASDVKSFLMAHKMTYLLLMEEDLKVFGAWTQVPYAPQIFLIDKHNVVR